MRHEAEKKFLKGKYRKQRSEDKNNTDGYRKECEFSLLILIKATRINRQATSDQKKKKCSEKNISRRFCEDPYGEETCRRRRKDGKRLELSQVAQREKNESEPDQYQDNKQSRQGFPFFVERGRFDEMNEEREEREPEEYVKNKKDILFLMGEFCRKCQTIEGNYCHNLLCFVPQSNEYRFNLFLRS